jgi:Cu+-exporting ATPase
VLTAPVATSTHEESGAGSLITSELELGGMHCSACATRIERTLGRLPAVASASVNLATTRAFITYDAATLDLEDVYQAVADIGYSAHVVDAGEGSSDGRESEHWVLRASVAWPMAIAALLVSLLLPQNATQGWTVLGIAVVVELAAGWPFLRDAGRLLRHGAVSMDTLTAFGTLAAVAVQAVEVIAIGGRHIHIGSGSGAFASRLHYAMAPVIVAIFVTGRAAEAGARRRAVGAMQSLLSLRPPTARVVTDPDDEDGKLVAPESVPVGADGRQSTNRCSPGSPSPWTGGQAVRLPEGHATAGVLSSCGWKPWRSSPCCLDCSSW